MDQEPSLPDDVLADILRRLAPHSLAVSRCVCKAWCRIVHAHRLLCADLLPLSLGDIFFNYCHIYHTQFLSRPTTGATISGRLDYTSSGDPNDPMAPLFFVRDHCNGLLLLDHCVVNPATRQWAPLPPCRTLKQSPPSGMHCCTDVYLVFDPTLSSRFILPDVPFKLSECEESDWPPPTMTLPMFSSNTGSWEERTFHREGEAAGMVPDMVGSARVFNHHSGYWRGALYICCSDCFVLRISLSNNKYRVIRLPIEDEEFYLGKSIKRIYCAALVEDSELQVWFLNSQTEWVLKHDKDIFRILPNLDDQKLYDGPWILQEFNYSGVQGSDEDSALEDNNDAILEEKFDWDSENGVLEPGSRIQDCYVYFLGFHPFKEVVFLSDKFYRVLAYNWSTSKLQDMGRLYPKLYLDRLVWDEMLRGCFPYTPCWLGELHGKLNLEAQLED